MSGELSDQEAADDGGAPAIALTDTQHRILESLCRPAGTGSRYSTPATNQEIAGEVYLSVDAVKAHLRTLYRKFGIEDLPHNRKRARLVELVLEGRYLGSEAGQAPAATPRPAADSATEPPVARRRLWPAAAVLGAAAAIALLVLALTGSFSGEGPAPTSVAAYKAAVSGYCRLALSGEQSNPGATARRRAGSYLEVIETMRGRLASLSPPAAVEFSLERFRDGLSRAANFTSIVAQHPPAPGSRGEANVVAELTFAAGQVQAGALGYGLGPSCIAIGDLVARSASNAAHSP
jgi:DNA-binding MarR family transcriptional regulator